MRELGYQLAAGALAASLASQGAAQNSFRQQWQVEHQDTWCVASTNDTQKLTFSVWMTPGDPEAEFYVVGSPRLLRTRGADKINVILEPNSQTFAAHVTEGTESTGEKVLRISELDAKFAEALSHASEIRLTGLREAVFIPIKGADQAMAAVGQCNDEKLSEWGIEAKDYHAPQTPPTEIQGYEWITADDYPSFSRAMGQTGDVVARIGVDATGRVTKCAVVVSSRSTSLDTMTCARALARGRFHPAIGSDGQPTGAVRTVHLVFQLR